MAAAFAMMRPRTRQVARQEGSAAAAASTARTASAWSQRFSFATIWRVSAGLVRRSPRRGAVHPFAGDILLQNFGVDFVAEAVMVPR